MRPQFPNKQPQELGECVCEYVWEGERIEGRHVLEHSMGAVRCQPSATLCAGRVPLAVCHHGCLGRSSSLPGLPACLQLVPAHARPPPTVQAQSLGTRARWTCCRQRGWSPRQRTTTLQVGRWRRWWRWLQQCHRRAWCWTVRPHWLKSHALTALHHWQACTVVWVWCCTWVAGPPVCPVLNWPTRASPAAPLLPPWRSGHQRPDARAARPRPGLPAQQGRAVAV